MTDQFQEPPRAIIRARPVRVAYLLTDCEHAHLMLDGIIARSLGLWGGRYSLICPCNEGYPRASYLPWLREFDPDIIYSFIDLAEDNLRRIREDFGPAYFIRHREVIEGEPTSEDFSVGLPMRPLASLSTTLQYARAFPVSAPQPIRVVDYLPGQPNDRFIDDNFGSFYHTYGLWPIPPNLMDAVKPLAIASKGILSASGLASRYEGDTVPSAAALLRFMAENRNTFGLAQLAADATPRIEIRENYTSAFTLLVGDTFADRVAFWNLRSRDPVFLGREPTSLIVSPSRLDDVEFFDALVEFLKKRNGVPRNSGTPWVQLCSTSLPTETLAALQQRLSSADRWNGYTVGARITLDSIAPSEKVLENAQYLVTGGFFERAPEWKEFSALGDKIHPPAMLPRHIAFVQSGSLATSGAWALDVRIERQESHSRYSNVRHDWFFPRRLRFHRAFLDFYEAKSEGHEYRHTRATVRGFLSLFAGFKEELPTIIIPNDEGAFRFSMLKGDSWPPFRSLDRWERPRGPFAWVQPSDKGRYLIGTLRMFGGLQNAASVLLHKYWRTVFEELGGAIGTARREQIKQSFKKKIRAVSTQPAQWDEDTWERIASLVASEAHQVRIPQQSLSFDELLRRHEPFLESEQQVLKETGADDPDYWMRRARRSLSEGVQRRCARRIMFQGYKWRCDTCFSTNWNDIGALRPELECSVCGAAKLPPVDEPWSFRLNGFLQDAMREHGILALLWCLVTLESHALKTFFFLGPHNLWKEPPENEGTPHDNEADLICVLDGRVHLCEVKSSAREIALPSLVEVAKRLRPDVVTLAVMDGLSGRLTSKMEELKEALADTQIEGQLLTLLDNPDWKNAYLP
jgi:hypothetical protein